MVAFDLFENFAVALHMSETAIGGST